MAIVAPTKVKNANFVILNDWSIACPKLAIFSVLSPKESWPHALSQTFEQGQLTVKNPLQLRKFA
jgi:hypothetical protein